MMCLPAHLGPLRLPAAPPPLPAGTFTIRNPAPHALLPPPPFSAILPLPEVPLPAPTRRLAAHVAATVLAESTAAAVVAMLPYIARKQFAADDMQTMLITIAMPACQAASIFWNHLLERTGPARYTLLIWLFAWAPLGLARFAGDYWQLLALFGLAAIGMAGLYPLKGTLLRHLYPDAMRGRINGVLNTSSLLGSAGLAFALGWWLNRDGEAFRIYMPIAIGVQLCGAVVLLLLARMASRSATGQHGTQFATKALPEIQARKSKLENAAAGWLAPLHNMHRILRDDPLFRRYEQAFMTYGAGYMICEVLLPLMLDKRLHMHYADMANSTRVVWNIGVVLMSLPAGWAIDRLGAARTSALSFAILAFYPLTLAGANSTFMIAVASAIYGVALAGVNQGWMLGPVALAPRPQLVPQYVAIHSTLVGFRGVVFQSAGMLLYWLSADFLWPLLAAIGLFAWAAWQMHRLHYTLSDRDRRLAEQAAAEPTPDLAVAEPG